jgi:hypothetical protein
VGAEIAQLFFIPHDLQHLSARSQPNDTGCGDPEISSNTSVPKYPNSPAAICGHQIRLIPENRVNLINKTPGTLCTNLAYLI